MRLLIGWLLCASAWGQFFPFPGPGNPAPAAGTYYLGNQTAGGSTDSGSNYIVASKFVASNSGSATAITVNCASNAGGPYNLAVAVYADSAGSPSGQARLSNSVTISCPLGAQSWVSTAITLSVVSGTTYWLAMNQQGGSATQVSYMTGAANQQYFVGNPYTGTMPATMPAASTFGTNEYSIYVTYN